MFTILAAFRVIVREVLQGFFSLKFGRDTKVILPTPVCLFILYESRHTTCLLGVVWRDSVGVESLGQGTGDPNAVLANRIIKCIYAVFLANKIIRCIYLCSCVLMCRFRRDLNPIRDG